MSRQPSPIARYRVPCSLVLAWAVTLGALPGAADVPRGAALPSDHAERERVRLVLLSATVTNRQGKPVRGLTVDDFRLREDGQAQEIDFFATEAGAPIALGFLLDVSGSMRQGDKLEEAKRAIGKFVLALGDQDRFGLICFADDQVTWVTEFTSDVERFLERLEVQRGYGQTALYDALAASPRLVAEGVQGRRAIVLVTDGIDNASRLPMLQAVWLARQVPVPIYSIAFLPMASAVAPRRVRDNLQVLERFARETGGEAFTVEPAVGPRQLDRAIARIQEELRFQYVIGYYPKRTDRDGSFRRIELETLRDQLSVRTREGYYATP